MRIICRNCGGDVELDSKKNLKCTQCEELKVFSNIPKKKIIEKSKLDDYEHVLFG